jgi:hypothetical protein
LTNSPRRAARINPLLEEIELEQKVDSLLSFEELQYVMKDSRIKGQKFQKIERTISEVESSSIDYAKKSRMLQKIYGVRFALGLRENDYTQLLAAGSFGFILGFVANDRLRNYFNGLAKEFVADFQKYPKS